MYVSLAAACSACSPWLIFSADMVACATVLGSVISKLKLERSTIVITIAPQMGDLYPYKTTIASGLPDKKQLTILYDYYLAP